MKTIKVKELEVPVGAMPEVVDILMENDLENSLAGTDEDHEVIFLKVRYDKDDEDQRSAVHEIEDIIANTSYRTIRVNEVLALICSADRASSGPKKELAPVFGSQSNEVPGTGFEPAHPFERRHLKTVRLPISPPGHQLGLQI